jgi:hypothetical protein
MSLNPETIDRLYLKYGYSIVNKSENVKLFLYEQGRYFGADIIPLNNDNETIELCQRIKKEYGDGGYAAQIRDYIDDESVALELYRSFFSYDTTKKRIERTYANFTKSQKRLNGGYDYEYINSPFTVNSEVAAGNDLINQIVEKLTINRPQLIIIEASAGYGKTCTAYEILKKLIDCPFCENPLMTVLSRNRGANIFRYILLDEIDREYSTLDSVLVNYEISTGRIPLLIDGFDELLNKSEIVKSEKDKVFGEVETMLDTIGSLLKNKARVILTSRKTAIFAGEEFQKWLSKWNNEFDVTRFSLEVPRIKDWLSEGKLIAIKQAQLPVEYIANPVLLTYLRNLDETPFEYQISEPDLIIKKYFTSLLEREITRQDLKINPDDQYKILKNVVRLLIKLDKSSEEKDFFREIILDENQQILQDAIKLYSPDKSVEWLADKLINHALLDRKGSFENEIGFINDFVFGTFVGEILCETTVDEIEKFFSAYMIEMGATAYRVQNSTNKEILWAKINTLKEYFESSILFVFDITLKNKLERNFDQSIFQSIQIFKIRFTNEFQISSSVFINCKFKNCIFEVGAFNGVSFIECLFEDCVLEDIDYINNFNNSYTIKCYQKNCSVLSYLEDESTGDGLNTIFELENKILSELYAVDQDHTSQRLLHTMHRFNKSDYRLISQLIDKLENEKILKVIGSDMYIEINKMHIVKQRIGII